MSNDNADVLLAVHFLYARATSATDQTFARLSPERDTALTHPAAPTRQSAAINPAAASPAQNITELSERLERQGSHADARVIADTALTGSARAAATGAPSLTVTAYDRARAAWLKETNTPATAGERTWPPTSQTVMARLGGTWNSAMRAAGLPVSAGGRKAGSGSFTEAQMAAVVADFLAADAGESFGAFSTWLSEQKDQQAKQGTTGSTNTSSTNTTSATVKLPSAAAVRKRFGTWNAAKEAAATTQAG